MAKPVVLLEPHFRTLEEIFFPEDLARLHEMADVVWGRDGEMPAAERAKRQHEVEIVISGWWRHGSPRDWPRLKAFIETGGTLPPPQHFDYAACFEKGIRVLSCAPAFGPAVAEMALGLALAAARKIAFADRAFRSGTEAWGREAYEDSFSLFEKPVGFVGFGTLARHLKALLAPFKCPIKAYDPWLTTSFLEEQGVQPTGLEDLLMTSKVSFILAIPTPENKGLVDRRRLELIPRNAVFVLASRAHLVDFDALTELVLAGRFKAGIDVFPKEPLPADHPIRKAEGAVLTPHMAGGMPEARRRIGRLIVRDVEAILAGLPPQHLQSAQPELIGKFR